MVSAHYSVLTFGGKASGSYSKLLKLTNLDSDHCRMALSGAFYCLKKEYLSIRFRLYEYAGVPEILAGYTTRRKPFKGDMIEAKGLDVL